MVGRAILPVLFGDDVLAVRGHPSGLPIDERKGTRGTANPTCRVKTSIGEFWSILAKSAQLAPFHVKRFFSDAGQCVGDKQPGHQKELLRQATAGSGSPRSGERRDPLKSVPGGLGS